MIFSFLFFFSERAARAGGGGGALPDFFFFFFPCSADHERDWPPCKVLVVFRVGSQCAECEKQQQSSFFGLATNNTLNVKNNSSEGLGAFRFFFKQHAHGFHLK